MNKLVLARNLLHRAKHLERNLPQKISQRAHVSSIASVSLEGSARSVSREYHSTSLDAAYAVADLVVDDLDARNYGYRVAPLPQMYASTSSSGAVYDDVDDYEAMMSHTSVTDTSVLSSPEVAAILQGCPVTSLSEVVLAYEAKEDLLLLEEMEAWEKYTARED